MWDARKHICKSTVIWLVTLSMILTLLPGAVFAAEKTAVSLEESIKIVKSVFEVPKEFNHFSSGYNQYNDREVWSLNWSVNNEKGGSMNAEVDARTGEILNMSIWQYSMESQPNIRIPVISRAQAVKIGEKLLDRLQAGRLKELALQVGSEELLPLASWGPVTYRLHWQRLVNGIPFSEDGVTIAVDNQTGQVSEYNFRWTNGEFPDAGKAISAAQAREAFDSAESFKLQYFRPNSREKSQKRPVMLVYRVDNTTNGVIDALTGKPVDINGLWVGNGGMGGAEKSRSMDQNNSMEVPLTPQEVDEVTEAAKIISREDALATVGKWVYISADLKLQNANLYSNGYEDPQLRTWSFSWSNTKTEAAQPSYLNARVNAVTGELLGFDRYTPWLEQEKQTPTKWMTREETLKIVEDFLLKIQPERFRQVKLQESSEPIYKPLAEGEQTPYQYFNYRRIVNGLEFPGNGFNVNVNTSTGEITAYEFNWSELEFPLPEGILGSKAATDRYLARQSLTLQYIQIYQPNDDREIRLVYRPQPVPNAPQEAMTDARTGEALDWEGKPLANQPRPYRFNDISGWAEKEISLLGQTGLFGEYGDNFRPASGVTAVQILRAMLGAREGVMGIYTMSDDQVMERVRLNGWVKEKIKPGDGLTREQLAVLMIRYLGLERAAKVKGIYKVNFTDASKISAGNSGYVALAGGLGILRGHGGKFNPTVKATRAEAAVVLVRTLIAGS